MTRQDLIALIRERRSFLCVGLDTDLAKMPAHLQGERDGVFRFNRAIVDATIDLCVAYKPNIAFYEALGLEGLRQLKLTMDYIHSLKKPVFTIADAKRGDIGNTSERYARAFLDPKGDFNFDAITVAPYMGADSVQPFTVYDGKWVILLALTSNKGAFDFQLSEDREGTSLYQRVLQTSKQWGNEDNMMYVVGATKADMLTQVRAVAPRNSPTSAALSPVLSSLFPVWALREEASRKFAATVLMATVVSWSIPLAVSSTLPTRWTSLRLLPARRRNFNNRWRQCYEKPAHSPHSACPQPHQRCKFRRLLLFHGGADALFPEFLLSPFRHVSRRVPHRMEPYRGDTASLFCCWRGTLYIGNSRMYPHVASP